MIHSVAISSIKNARNLALFLAGLLILRIIIVLLVLGIEFDPYALVDPILVAVLAFGVHKKSRIAAGILLIYYLLNLIINIIDAENIWVTVVSLLFAPIFIRYFVLGIRGTFAYHRNMKEKASTA